jgi:hypothetical protein
MNIKMEKTNTNTAIVFEPSPGGRVHIGHRVGDAQERAHTYIYTHTHIHTHTHTHIHTHTHSIQ